MPLTAPVIFQLIMLAASTAYQMHAAAKAKKKAKAARARAAEAAKDNAARRDIKISGSNESIPLSYGEVRRVPTLVYVNVLEVFNAVAPNAQETLLGALATFAGAKNETLINQRVLCAGEISEVVTATVDDEPFSDSDYLNFVRLYVNKVGGTVNTSTTLTRLPSATFDGLCYATEYFKMNRDDPQFGGQPESAYFLRAKLIRTYTGTTYNAAKTYSFNAIEVLLDYMTDTEVGPGLVVGVDIDNVSFAEAASISGEVVKANATFEGPFAGTRDLLRHEFHGSLFPELDHMENIETVLDTIPGAILLRDAAGLIKLSIPDPGLITPNTSASLSVGEVDDDVLITDIEYSQQDTTSRLNRLSVTYANAAKDFASDSFEITNATHLAADQGVLLSTEINLIGVNSEYHASGICNASLNESRMPLYKFSAAYEFLRYEPGDIVRLNSARNDIDTYVRINKVSMKNNYDVEVEAVGYDSSVYFYNSGTVVGLTSNVAFDNTIEPPTAVTATLVANVDSLVSSVKISWTPPDDVQAAYVAIEARMDTGSGIEWSDIGLVLGSVDHFIYTPNFITNYTFRVRSRTRFGRVSATAEAAPLDVTSEILKSVLQFDIESPQNIVRRDLATGITSPVSLSNDFTVNFGLDIATYDNSATMPAHTWKLLTPLTGNLPNPSQGSYALSITSNVGTAAITLDQTANSTYLASYLLLQFIVNPTANALADSDPAIVTVNKYIFITETSDGMSTKELTVYKVAGSVPATPTGGSYEFFSGTLVTPVGWVAELPDNTDVTQFVYASTATAFISSGANTTDSNLTWSSPLVFMRVGVRGAGWFRTTEAVSQGTLDGYSSATVNAKFELYTGTPAVTSDVFIISGTGTAVKAWIYNGSTWTVQAAFIEGGLLVDGTITAQHLAVDSITTTKIVAGSITTGLLNGAAVTTDKITVDAITTATSNAVGTVALGASATSVNSVAAVVYGGDVVVNFQASILGKLTITSDKSGNFYDERDVVIDLYRNGSLLKTWRKGGRPSSNFAGPAPLAVAWSMLHLDNPGVGTHTYDWRMYSSGGGSCSSSTQVVQEFKR